MENIIYARRGLSEREWNTFECTVVINGDLYSGTLIVTIPDTTPKDMIDAEIDDQIKGVLIQEVEYEDTITDMFFDVVLQLVGDEDHLKVEVSIEKESDTTLNCTITIPGVIEHAVDSNLKDYSYENLRGNSIHITIGDSNIELKNDDAKLKEFLRDKIENGTFFTDYDIAQEAIEEAEWCFEYINF